MTSRFDAKVFTPSTPSPDTVELQVLLREIADGRYSWRHPSTTSACLSWMAGRAPEPFQRVVSFQTFFPRSDFWSITWKLACSSCNLSWHEHVFQLVEFRWSARGLHPASGWRARVLDLGAREGVRRCTVGCTVTIMVRRGRYNYRPATGHVLLTLVQG